METFKTIRWFENYQVSDLWRVKSLNYRRTWKEQLLKPRVDKDWYMQVWLCLFWKQSNFQVHRLVGYAFLDNVNNKEQINHKNWFKYDNNIENLEWCTQSENMQHRYKTLWQKHRKKKQ